MNIVGLCGSLRAASLNRYALKLAGESMPPGMSLDIVEWRDIPAFDSDARASAVPAAVSALSARIRQADGVILATPEYNFSIPGAFKNMIDWVSREDPQPLVGKPVAILSASAGPLGGARVQYDLRKVLLFLNAMPLVKPEIFIGSAASKFDATSGLCTDETTRQFVTQQMVAFKSWIEACRRMAN